MNTKLNYVRNWAVLAYQTKWSVARLAKQCGVSGETLRQYFIKHLGQTPGVWLAEQRQRHALEMLRGGSSVKETAAHLGYKQQTNFTRKFKEHWGVCPSMPTLNQSAPDQTYKAK